VQYSFDHEKREALNAWGARLEVIIAAKDPVADLPADTFSVPAQALT
jgi:hypothetical protein